MMERVGQDAAATNDSAMTCRPSRVVSSDWKNIPLGRSKVPFSEPLARARLKREVKVASLVSPRALFFQTNFLRVWRLLRGP